MAVGLNKALLLGNLGSDPEIRYTPSGTAVANFRIATNEQWNNKEGNREERTEWHKIVVWGKLAELCKEYLSKGRQVYVEGRIQTRQWEDKDKNRRYTTEIIASNIIFLGSGQAPATATSSTAATAESETPEEPNFNPDDDIPF